MKKNSTNHSIRNSPAEPPVTLRQALAGLRKTETVLAGKNKNQPVILFRHGRWHMLIIGFVIGPSFKSTKGISTVHFMSTYRARKTIGEWLPYSRVIPYKEVCPHFEEELAAKVLPAAADYRILAQNKLVVLAGGFTTDTLHDVTIDQAGEERMVAAIQAMMDEGKAGPFLHFERSYLVLS